MWNEHVFFVCCWLFIGFVSSIDTYLTIKFQDDLFFGEVNPMARWMLEADNWDVSRFCGIKMFGTIFVLGILVLMYVQVPRHAAVVAGAMVAFQAWLLYYLYFA
jgi:hypothetical protein